MAKITRYNGNLVAPASSAPGTERTIFGSTSQSDDITTNYSSDLLAGWGLVGPNDAPPMQYFNAIAFTLGQVLAYLHQMGVAEWNATQEYHTGSVCVYGGQTWVSTSDSNVGNTPGVSNWVAHLRTTDIGSTVQAYDADTAKLDVAQTWVANQTFKTPATTSLVTIDSSTGQDASLLWAEGGVNALRFFNAAAASLAALYKYAADGSTVVSELRFYETGIVDFQSGTLQLGGSNALKASDIGSTVQAYDADTAKLDVAANFTAGLQDNGNAVLDVADIGSTVQAYDADTAKLDVAQTWVANQTFKTPATTSLVTIDSSTGQDASLLWAEGGVNALRFFNAAAASLAALYKYAADGSTVVSELRFYETGIVDFQSGTLQLGGSNALKASDIGSTVQAYDADTAKLDVSNTWTANQTLTTPAATSSLTLNAASGQNADISLKENGVQALLIRNSASANASYLFKYDAAGSGSSYLQWDENGDLNFVPGSASSGLFKYDGNELATVNDIPTGRGALVYRSAGQSIADGTWTAMEWDAEQYDTDTIHDNVTNKTRLTVPSGVTKVKVLAGIEWTSNTTGRRAFRVLRNGAGYVGLPFDDRNTVSGNTCAASGSSAVVAVSAGNYFEIEVWQNSGGSLSVTNAAATWFALEIVA